MNLIRRGDFYEAYGEDAEVLARELELTVHISTTMQPGVAMAGLPYHVLDRCIATMAEKGFVVTATPPADATEVVA